MCELVYSLHLAWFLKILRPLIFLIKEPPLCWKRHEKGDCLVKLEGRKVKKAKKQITRGQCNHVRSFFLTP